MKMCNWLTWTGVMEITDSYYKKNSVLEWMKTWNPATIKPSFQTRCATATYLTSLLLLQAKQGSSETEGSISV